MINTVLIAIALGLIAAVAFLSATTGPLPARLLFSLITPLPVMLAGLGWGVRAGLIAAFAGGVILVALLPSAGGFFLTTAALPAALLSYLALLSRPSAAAGDAPNTTSPEWYPVGRLVIWTAALAAIPAILWSIMLEAGGPELKDQLLKLLTDAIAAAKITHSTTGLPLSPDDIASLTKYIYAAMPAALAIAWMAALLLTLWLSGRIMRGTGQLTRPWPVIGLMEYPAGTAIALLAAIALSFQDGMFGLASRAIAGTLLFAFLLLGLAIVHELTKGWHWRSFMLGTIYSGLLLVTVAFAPPLALLGLSESIVQLRSRFRPPGGT